MVDVTLSPCPFCGAEAFVDGKISGPYQSCCSECDARTGPWYAGDGGVEKTVTAWNTRTLPNGSVEKMAKAIVSKIGMTWVDDPDDERSLLNKRQACEVAQAALAALGMKEEGV